MQIVTLGKNTITVCANCDELIAVKTENIPSGLDRVREAFDAHLSASSACGNYYDSLPTLEETIAELRKIEADRHAAHDCVTATCLCRCGCGLHVSCDSNLSDGLCWHCALRDMRGDDDHGLQNED